MTSMQFTPGRSPDGAVQDAVERGLYLAAEHVLGVARDRVPHEEGTLERSGVTKVDRDQATIAFDTPYAVRQHEEIGWRHDDGRQAKYLESAMNENVDVVRDLVATQVRRSLGQ
ncbi:hypothetical protein CLV28_0709 [Sediminihabitans luteus]|uniref:Minor capsid protein n=1 Tax=Sediminihabitans luteus TaxID=1138585 RepID=A0A2M9CZZ5_9CELL|nr:hypothetical protein [Sediminihabitans luteus]PJJ77490.1 hypothetical protein CLV28_0709 [Sediminihabitans luteus]GII98386.1 hypothetical protein Slu03_07640 [Sediminihabitans luteus]